MATSLPNTLHLILIGNKYILKKIDSNLIIVHLPCILNRKYIVLKECLWHLDFPFNFNRKYVLQKEK